MKHSQSEKGMALLWVLIIIIVFSILGTIVITLSVNNATQVDKTEQDMQAVDLAEMGVMYYKNKAILQVDKSTNDAITAAISKIQSENASIQAYNEQPKNKNNQKAYIPIEASTVLPRLSITANSFLPTDLLIGTAIPVNDSTDFSYTINNQNATLSGYQVTIDFVSFGQGRDDDATIDGNFTFDIDQLVNTYFSNGGTVGVSLSDMYLSSPTSLSECDYSSLVESNCSYVEDIPNLKQKSLNNITALIDGNVGLKSGNTSLTNQSFLYIVGIGDFNNLNGGISHSKLYVGSNADFGNLNANNGINSSNLDIRGNANFNDNVQGGINSSTIYVGQSLTFYKNVSTLNDSTIYVKENLHFKKGLDSITNSKICVGGTVSGISQSATNSWTESDGSTTYACRQYGGTSSSPADLLDSIAKQAKDSMGVEYD